MSTTSIKSRIARQLTLRRLEVTAVSATVLAFALTKILVGGTPLQETNPFALELVRHLGWTGVGVVAVLVEGAIFAGYRRLELQFPRVSLAGGGLVAVMGVVDVVWNIRWFATVGMPETILWMPVVDSVGVVALVGAVLLARPSMLTVLDAANAVPCPSSRTRQVVGSFALVLLLISSIPAGIISPSAVQVVEAATSEETNDLVWGGSQLYKSNGAEASSTSAPWGQYPINHDNKIISSNGVYHQNGTQIWEPENDGVQGHAALNDTVAIAEENSSDQFVRLYSLEDGEVIRTYPWTTSEIMAVELIPGSDDVLISYTEDDTDQTARVTPDGEEVWNINVATEDTENNLAYVNGSVYIMDYFDGWLHKIDANDGDTIDTASSPNDEVLKSVQRGDDGKLWVGAADNYFWKVDQDLNFEEEYETSVQDGNGAYIRHIREGPSGDVYVGSQQGGIARYDTENDTEVWYNDVGNTEDYIPLGESWRGGTSGAGADINGTVENQDGQPVDNATVTVTGIDREELDADPGELDAEAQEILNELEDPTPPNWSADRTLTGSDGLFTEADTKYVAAHEKGDWGLSRTTDTPNLGKPSVQLPANEEIALSVWDPEAGGLVQDGVNSDLPGGVDDDTDIVVESIDHDGGTVDTRTLETDTTYDTVIGGEHDLATTELPAGFYRVYPEDHPETSYVVVVGDPQEIANTIRGDLKDEAGDYTAQAERVRELKNENVLKEYTTTTDENGSFSVDVPDSVTRVSVQAHKTPPGMTEDPEEASLQDVRDYYAVTDYNGSYVMPASAETHSVPANDITVDTVETEAPQYADLGRYANATEAFQALLQNMSYSELPSSLQQRLEDVDRERLEENANKLQRLSNENSQLESRIEEIREERDLGEIEINDSSDEELREQIQAQQQAISELRSTIETGETDTEVSDGAASSTATFLQDLSKDQVRVVANFPNGTSQEVSDEYVTLDHSAGTIVGEGDTQVAVEDYPLGDASGVTFDYVVVTEEGIGETTTNAVKPGADSIGLDAISLSSLHPGPDEQVDVSLVGDDETQVTEITDVRAVSPDGEELDTSTEGADTATFTTDGEGRHYVELEFETASGEEGTLTHRIAAGESDRAMPPGIRIKDTPFGTVAVVGDGYEAGSAEVSNGGQTIDVTAQVGADEDAPARTHLYAHGADLPPTSTLSVDIVRGDQQRAVQRHVEVTAHLPAIRSEKATFYRGDDALPREGEGKLADVSTSSDETTIVTVTDARGSLELKTNSNPGTLERWSWWIDRNSPELSLGVLGQVPAFPTVPVPDVTGAIDTGAMQVAAPAPTIDASGPAAVAA